MFYNKRFSLFLLISITSITFASEKPAGKILPISYLELFPGKGLKPVTLNYPYYSPTQEEKNKSVYLQEGCYTILEKEDDCALVGPLQPCQFFSLSINEKTVVAHLSADSNLPQLLVTVKNTFPDYDSSKITGELFTNNWLLYDLCLCRDKVTGKTFSYRQFCHNRTQNDDLKFKKDLILKELGIQDRNQIKAQKFTTSKKDFELGDYESAELFVFIKINNHNKPTVFNTCQMAEKYFGDFKHLPLAERYQKTMGICQSIQNPYHTQISSHYIPAYGALPFYYVPNTSN